MAQKLGEDLQRELELSLMATALSKMDLGLISPAELEVQKDRLVAASEAVKPYEPFMDTLFDVTDALERFFTPEEAEQPDRAKQIQDDAQRLHDDVKDDTEEAADEEQTGEAPPVVKPAPSADEAAKKQADKKAEDKRQRELRQQAQEQI